MRKFLAFSFVLLLICWLNYLGASAAMAISDSVSFLSPDKDAEPVVYIGTNQQYKVTLGYNLQTSPFGVVKYKVFLDGKALVSESFAANYGSGKIDFDFPLVVKSKSRKLIIEVELLPDGAPEPLTDRLVIPCVSQEIQTPNQEPVSQKEESAEMMVPHQERNDENSRQPRIINILSLPTLEMGKSQTHFPESQEQICIWVMYEGMEKYDVLSAALYNGNVKLLRDNEVVKETNGSVQFTFKRPGKGWKGTFRVEVSYNESVLKDIVFTVEGQ